MLLGLGMDRKDMMHGDGTVVEHDQGDNDPDGIHADEVGPEVKVGG